MMSKDETVSEPRAQSPLWRLLFLEISRLWFRALKQNSQSIYVFLAQRGLVQLVFLAANLGLMVFAAPHWISYRVTFEELGTYTLGSDMRIFFFFSGILGLSFSVFRFHYGLALYLVYLLSMAILYGMGFLVPEWVHVNFNTSADLQFRWSWILAWGGCLFLALMLARDALRTPFVEAHTMASWLFDERTAFARSKTQKQKNVRIHKNDAMFPDRE